MITEHFASPTRTGTFGGTLLVMLLQLNLNALLHTIVIAAVGAATSFCVSIALNQLTKFISRNKGKGSPHQRRKT